MRILKLTLNAKEDSVRDEAIQILINSLDLTKVSFFIRDNLSNQTDYLEMKKKLFGDKTVSEIYNKMKTFSNA